MAVEFLTFLTYLYNAWKNIHNYLSLAVEIFVKALGRKQEFKKNANIKNKKTANNV